MAGGKLRGAGDRSAGHSIDDGDFGYTGKSHWTEAHKRYLRDLKLPFKAHCIIMEELISQIDQLEARIARLETHMELMCADWGLSLIHI